VDAKTLALRLLTDLGGAAAGGETAAPPVAVA
jgi:hypothetical protein